MVGIVVGNELLEALSIGGIQKGMAAWSIVVVECPCIIIPGKGTANCSARALNHLGDMVLRELELLAHSDHGQLFRSEVLTPAHTVEFCVTHRK